MTARLRYRLLADKDARKLELRVQEHLDTRPIATDAEGHPILTQSTTASRLTGDEVLYICSLVALEVE